MMLPIVLAILGGMGAGYGVSRFMDQRKAGESASAGKETQRDFAPPTPLWELLRRAEAETHEPLTIARGAVIYALARKKWGDSAADQLDAINAWLLRDELAGTVELEDCLCEVWYAEYSLREARHELMRLTSLERADRFEALAERWLATLDSASSPESVPDST